MMVTVGTEGYQSVMGGGTYHLSGEQRLLGAVEVGHYDGPWKPAQDFKKVNAVLRYSQGTANDGVSLTGMFYKALVCLRPTSRCARSNPALSAASGPSIRPTPAGRCATVCRRISTSRWDRGNSRSVSTASIQR